MKIKDFKIERGCDGFYIFSNSAGEYLQTDRTPYRNCAHGWFKSKKEAQECLDEYLGKNTLNLPKEIPQPPEPPDGYEYVDRGFAWRANDVHYICYDKGLGSKAWSGVSRIQDKYHANGLDGCYYLEVVKKEEKTMTLEQQIKFAKSLVGKRIRSIVLTNETFLIQSFNVGHVIPNRFHSTVKDDARETLKKQDVFVFISGAGYDRLILPDSKPSDFEIQKEVKVNGYVAEDMGDYYKFGCATISKNRLLAAKTFLEDNSCDKCSSNNRKAKSVTIGAGEFTLEILNQLV